MPPRKAVIISENAKNLFFISLLHVIVSRGTRYWPPGYIAAVQNNETHQMAPFSKRNLAISRINSVTSPRSLSS